jgi:hypothetical protein
MAQALIVPIPKRIELVVFDEEATASVVAAAAAA